MATLNSFCRALLFFFITFSSLQSIFITCTQFEVGDHHGWAVPGSNDGGNVYNNWASQNRFLVNDTLHFKYKEESVMEVRSEDYDKCKSTNPISYFNNGDTIFALNRSDFFYFISGVSGHCTRGLKMAVKVLDPHQYHHPTPPPAPPTQNSTSHTTKTGLLAATAMIVALLGFLLLQ